MIRIHATKKLFAKFKLNDDGHLPHDPRYSYPANDAVDINPLRDWHANLLIVQRRNCVVLVQDQTRFPLFIPCLTKKDFDTFQIEFEHSLMNTLLKCDASESQLNAARGLLEKIAIDTVCDRSVQGTQTLFGQHIKDTLEYDNLNVTEVSGHRVGAHLAETPCTVKGRKGTVWPKRDMLAILDKCLVGALRQ